jgi:16S rRNA (cytosine1402-N4)-methyltransferase
VTGEAAHRPVMVGEVLAHLAPARGGVFVDGTVGLGGPARAVLEAGASRVIGIDRDPAAVARAGAALAEFGDRAVVAHGDYRQFEAVLDALGIDSVAGLLVDLGVSSMQLDSSGRGFSFRRDEPLDMRMDPTAGPTAAELIAGADERTLADVIYEFGEERRARRIARAIVRARDDAPVATTGQLAAIARRGAPGRPHTWRIDPATRTFQAVRVWVNGELEGLDGFLERAARRLDRGGRLVVLTFQSLEDRVVKHGFRALAAEGGFTVRTKRPERPGETERMDNPRARSAKLRAMERDG